MNRATEVRLSKLEANVPAPASPFDGLTIDELSVFLLEEYSELVAHDDMPEEIRPMRNGTSRALPGRSRKPSTSPRDAAPQCMRECLNSRRGGFKASDRSTPERYH
jgi:hypothetical protein